MRQKVLIVDYGVGNHQSVANALKRLGYDFILSGKSSEIADADCYILPGVGAFGEAVKNMKGLGIGDLIKEQVLLQKKPILGICLGMQLMAEYSEENGLHKGLGLIEDSRVIRLEPPQGFCVPHVGWNDIEITKQQPLFIKSEKRNNFYFDHSYHFVCKNQYVSATTWHGIEIICAIQKDNMFGVQFHPEKSQNSGLKIFRAFFNYIDKLNLIFKNA